MKYGPPPKGGKKGKPKGGKGKPKGGKKMGKGC
jgi:hypothetical protein